MWLPRLNACGVLVRDEGVSMSPWISVGLFLLVIVCIPIALKVVQSRYGLGLPAQVHGQPRLVTALSLGAGQRLVVVDVGPDDARERLTLGVTAQGINCLHRFPIGVSPNATTVTQ